LRQLYGQRKSVVLAGTALLGAIVIVLDWTLKIAGLKIQFPPLPFLKFDFVGVPVLLAYFLFGFPAGTITSLAAFLSISFRGPSSGFMRFLAEFATIIGVFIILRTERPANGRMKILAMISGIIVRVALMAVANLLLLPVFMPAFYATHMAVVVLLPLFSLFNAIQGFFSVFGGFLLYETVIQRLPSLK
jgi:riboflavin transporter FmnP